MSISVLWLRKLAENGGKGTVDNIDARSLARIADEIVRMQEALQFYATGWVGHPGDSGPGGNIPADPVLEVPEWLMEDAGKRAREALK